MHENTPARLFLTEADDFYLSLTLSTVSLFPSSISDGGPFPRSLLMEAANSRSMTPLQLLAGAYFGFLPIARSFKSFCAQTQQRNRHRDDDEHEKLRLLKDEVARENESSSEFGFTRGEMKRLYRALDRLALQYGFASFEAVWNCRQFIESDPAPMNAEERAAFACGPRFLWDFAKRARVERVKSVAFGELQGWVLFIRRESGSLCALGLSPTALRHGGFGSPPEELRANEVLAALNEIVQRICPGCEPKLVRSWVGLSLTVDVGD